MNIPASKTYWEKVSENRWGMYTSNLKRDAILQAHNLLNSPLSALDIGADGGKWSILLSQMGFNMTCIDISSESIEICKKRLPDAKCILVNKDDETLPVQLSSQSMILCIGVPPVIQSNWLLPEISRALKPGA